MLMTIVMLASPLAVRSAVPSTGRILHVGTSNGASDRNPGTPSRPFATIQAAVDRAAAGDTVRLLEGVYRQSFVASGQGRPEAPIRIEAAPGAEVIISGADVIPAGKWKTAGTDGLWKLDAWTYRGCPGSRTMAHPPDDFHQLIGRTEQVIVSGKLLMQVDSRTKLMDGSFWADPLQSHVLMIKMPASTKPDTENIEVSLRAELCRLRGAWIEMKGLVFRHACNHAQQPAVLVEGSHIEVSDCRVEQTNGVGLRLEGRNNSVIRTDSIANGQMGMAGAGFDNRLEECRLVRNNLKGFNKAWESGAIKVVLSRNFQILRCVAEENDGPGFWYDIDNRQSLVEGCLAVANHGPGIMIEISETATIRGNICLRNGLRDERGDWAHTGILLAEAMNCIVEGNICVANRTGIGIRQQEIRDIRPDLEWERPQRAYYYSQGHVIRRNVSAFNREWQFALLADNPFFTPDRDGIPAGDRERLDPAKRELQTSENLYWPGKADGLICWAQPGCRWHESTEICRGSSRIPVWSATPVWRIRDSRTGRRMTSRLQQTAPSPACFPRSTGRCLTRHRENRLNQPARWYQAVPTAVGNAIGNSVPFCSLTTRLRCQ